MDFTGHQSTRLLRWWPARVIHDIIDGANMSSVRAHFLRASCFVAGALLATVETATPCPMDCSSRGLFTSRSWQIVSDWRVPGICRTGAFPWQSGYCEVAYIRAEPYGFTGGNKFVASLPHRPHPAAPRPEGLVRHVDAAPRHPAGATTLRESACKQYPNLC
jgi:hypothetical protein